MMQAGDADAANVPVANRSQMDALVGEKCIYDVAAGAYKPCEITDATQPFRVYLGMVPIQQDVILYNWGIATSEESPNPYLGSGKLDGNGIPPDFFNDIHVRKAFAYCFDWDTFINDVYKGEAVQSIAIVLPGMPGYFADIPHYTMDLAKCEEEFKASELKSADGASLWDTGFRVQMLYNQGNSTRQTMSEILQNNLSTVNAKFQVEVLGLPWASYLRSQRAKQIPIMTAGWIEDIHDPSNWYQPYTLGTYAGRASLPAELKAQFSEILDKGVAETDPVKRGEIYKAANQLYYDQVVGVPVVLGTGHGFRQRWVEGEVLNPIFPGFHYYEMFKD
jgi:peptide/nickel transport system substrate-binding protein